MRCPKCHYLSFEPEPKCKNCGYDFFALTDGDLALTPDDPGGAPLDLKLTPQTATSDASAAPPATRPAPPGDAQPPRPSNATFERAVVAPPRAAPRGVRAPTTTTELPLFVRGLPDSDNAIEPPIASSPASRPPLAVRRRSPDAPVSTIRSQSRPPDPGPLGDDPVQPPVWATVIQPKAMSVDSSTNPGATSDDRATGLVSPGRRGAAVIVDAALLWAIDATVIWLTLRLCSLTLGQATALPALPLLAFFVVLDLGYLLLFTATSGQTVGKMVMKIRVVGAASQPSLVVPVTPGQAFIRSVASVPSVLVLGAGLLPVLLGRGLAVHDRIAHTRVVLE